MVHVVNVALWSFRPQTMDHCVRLRSAGKQDNPSVLGKGAQLPI